MGPLSIVLAPLTLPLGDSFSTLPLVFSAVAFTLLHATRHCNLGVRINKKLFKMFEFVQSFGTLFPYSFAFTKKNFRDNDVPAFFSINAQSFLGVQDT